MLSSSGGRSFDALLAAPFQLAPGKASSVVKTANAKHVTVVLSETFLQARASTCYNNIRQVQTLPFVSAQGLKDVVPEKAHTRFQGTGEMPSPLSSACQYQRRGLRSSDANTTMYGNRLASFGAVDRDQASNRPDSGVLAYCVGRRIVTRTCFR